MSIEAMKMALEALQYPWKSQPHTVVNAITALRAAIAEAAMQRLTDVQQEMEQQPVAWVPQWAHDRLTGQLGAVANPLTWGVDAPLFARQTDDTVPLFTHPPRREWVGLTDEEMRQAAQAMDAEPLAEGWKELIKFARAIEAKLKEKNA
ncbi:MAG: hypothetical protein RL563_2679 [Pseudomonadota bacterium]|jgi:hypothetical protein